uniref:KIX domain-containing protein n=1 Tax=Panagrolaimus sp. JU765 TaxID=591449 RepID=A0AC34RT69_9BILA
MRKRATAKMIVTEFPEIDLKAMEDQKNKDLIKNARRIEKEMFENADSKNEYFQLLVKVIHKIREQLKEKGMSLEPTLDDEKMIEPEMEVKPDNATTSLKTTAPPGTANKELIADPEKSVECDLDEC